VIKGDMFLELLGSELYSSERMKPRSGEDLEKVENRWWTSDESYDVPWRVWSWGIQVVILDEVIFWPLQF